MANISKLTYKGVTYDIYDASAQHSAYVLQKATHTVLGGVKPLFYNTSAVTGVTASSSAKTVAVNAITATAGKYYAVEIDTNSRLYVNVPWTDKNDNYTYSISGNLAEPSGIKITLTGANGGSSSDYTIPVMQAASASAAGHVGLVPAPAAGANTKFLRGDGTWQTVSTTDTNYTYSIGGAQDGTNGYKITLTGANGGSTTTTTVPRFNSTNDGLVPVPTGPQISDGSYFLNASGAWENVNKHHVWFLNSKTNYGNVVSGSGSWTATFPSTNMIGNPDGLISCSSYSGSPKVGDTIITAGGFIGYISQLDSTTPTNNKAKFVGRFDFMAYDASTAATDTYGTGYDASTETLILGMY